MTKHNDAILEARRRAEEEHRQLRATKDGPSFLERHREPETTDYCRTCGESPDSGSHWVGPDQHAYVAPWQCCKRDNDGDGNCHIHSSPGVLRQSSSDETIFTRRLLVDDPADMREVTDPELRERVKKCWDAAVRPAYRENQKTVSDWAVATFGPVGSNARVAARVNEEMAELLRAVTSDAPADKVAAECADIVIVLYRLADRLELVLDLSIAPMERSGDRRTFALATRANRHMAILMQQLDAIETHGPSANNGTSLWIDCARDNVFGVVCLMQQICSFLGRDLRAEIDKKMAINRARRWELDGTGCGRHVRREKDAS